MSWDHGERPSRPSTGRGCLPGCLLSGFVAVVILIVAANGVGFPKTYWHHIGDVQAFEGPDRVVVFVEVERAMKWPGLLSRPPHNFAAGFLRIDVFPDGRVERTVLYSDLEGHITLNTNLYAVAHLADGFYLLEKPSYAPRPAYRLGPDQVERLSREEATKAAGDETFLAGAHMFDLSKIDAISSRRGWRRLNRDHGGGPYLLIADPIDSTSHGMRLRHSGRWMEDGPETIVAESLSSTDRWTRTLIKVDMRRWESYQHPSDRAYLRARYAASPAH
jgi:hypothetical protein